MYLDFNSHLAIFLSAALKCNKMGKKYYLPQELLGELNELIDVKNSLINQSANSESSFIFPKELTIFSIWQRHISTENG